MNRIEDIFAGIAPLFRCGVFREKTTFYFCIDEVRKTLVLDGENCAVEDGKAVAAADCVCKTGKEFFLRIWEEGYRPGMKDFLGGSIKSNAPHLLQQFMTAFGKPD